MPKNPEGLRRESPDSGCQTTFSGSGSVSSRRGTRQFGWIFLLFFLAASCPLSAWSRTGHMIVAAIAYRQLSRPDQMSFLKILRHHEDYSEWERDFNRLEERPSLGEYLFMRASLWPDEIRRTGHRDDHERWHYINYPLHPPDFSFRPGEKEKDNVLFGIRKSGRTLGDRSSSLEEKAASLAWAIHLIGDIHQPLHCALLIDSTFPGGDRGGTEFYVRPGSKSVPLHTVWDSLLGTRFDPRRARNEATRLLGKIRGQVRDRLRSLGTAETWSLESRLLAVREVYLEGRLNGVPEKARRQAPRLPDGYTGRAQEIAEERALLAGFRLAGWLSSVPD